MAHIFVAERVFPLRTCILYANTSMNKKCAIRCIRHKERIMWTCIYFTDEYEYLSIVHELR